MAAEKGKEEDLRAALLRPSDHLSADAPHERRPKGGDGRLTRIQLNVRGISCASCAAAIESALSAIRGVEKASVSPLQGQALVTFRPGVTDVRFPNL